MSLPRVLTLGPTGQVVMRPAPELAALRAEHMGCTATTVPAGQIAAIPEIRGDTLELIVELSVAAHGSGGIVVRCLPDGAEQTRICYDAALRQLIVDRSQSSLDLTADRNPHIAPLTLGPNEPLRLQIFLDRSVLEVFANERVSITSRI